MSKLRYPHGAYAQAIGCQETQPLMFDLHPEVPLWASYWHEHSSEIEKLLASRAAKDTLDKLLATPPEFPAEAEDRHPVDDLFLGKLEMVGKRIEHLKRDLATRSELNTEFVAQLDYQISRAAQSLEAFRGFGVGYNEGVDWTRSRLERQLEDFRRERRSVRLRMWQDIVSLRRELQETIAEYTETLRRYRLAGHVG